MIFMTAPSGGFFPAGGHSGMMGVLHKATVTPRAGKSRPVDSIMLRTADPAEVPPFTAEQLRSFIDSGAYLSA